MRRADVRKAAALLGGAMIYALLFALCSQIDEAGALTPGAFLPRFAAALPAAAAALYLLLEKISPAAEILRGGGVRRFRWPHAFLLILLGYMPMFLIEYPGTLCYDVQAQTFQIASGEYSAFHPLAHTLLIRLAIAFYPVLQSFERCAALYCLIQMTLLALSFSLVCDSLDRVCGRRAAYAAAAFFALYPAHMAFASSFTKDVLFSGFFSLYFALVTEDMACGPLSRHRRALMLASGVLACLFRNNMAYALAAWLVLLLLRGRRYARAALCGALALALGFGVNAGLRKWTNAADGSRVEMLSVPIQQLARARLSRPDCFTPEEAERMDAIFAEKSYLKYEPTLADPVKNALREADVFADFPEAVRLWASVGAKCPGVYLEAFLHLALPSLYPYRAYRVAQPYIETGEQPGALAAPFGQSPIVQGARLAPLRAWLAERIFDTGADDIPVVRLIFNCGVIFYLALACVLRMLYRGKWPCFAAALLLVMYYGTCLLGPVMQGRYLYPFICCLPTLAAWALGGRAE